MKVAITGASGHIGNCIVRKLINSGASIKVLVHQSGNNLEMLDVELIHGDILKPGTLTALCEGVDVVFHLAACISVDNRSSELVYSTNVEGTKNMIKAANEAGVKKFIHFSSIHAFQTNPADKVLDENRALITNSKEIYEYSKAESERIVMDAIQNGLNAVILSPTAVVGPYDYKRSLLGQALLKIYNNKLPLLVAGGYNWVDVRDVASAAVESVYSGRAGEKYILSGTYYSLKDLSVLIGKLLNRKTPQRIAPAWLARMAYPFFHVYYKLTKNEPLFTYQSLNIVANSPRNISFNKAQTELAYQPRSLEETLKDTFEWYKENNYLS